MLLLKIRLKSHSSFLLDAFINDLLQKIESFTYPILSTYSENEMVTSSVTNLSIGNKNNNLKKEGIKILSISLPNKKKYFTVLRSAHVHKKSREQFVLKIHAKSLIIDLTEILNICQRYPILRQKMPELFIIDKIVKFCKQSAPGIHVTFGYIKRG